MENEKIREFSKNYLDETKRILELIELDILNGAEKIVALLENAKEKRNTVFIMGNGGSGASSSNFVEDLAKGTIVGDSKRFKAISLADSNSAILAWANDNSYEDIFVEQLKSLMEPGDVVIGLSGSGNSMNVIKAIEYANNKGITIGFSGYDGGKLLKCAQNNIHVPSFSMQRVEDVHMIFFHILMCVLLENEKSKVNK